MFSTAVLCMQTDLCNVSQQRAMLGAVHSCSYYTTSAFAITEVNADCYACALLKLLFLCTFYSFGCCSVLGILEAAAFHPFVINNRRHFYVYRNSQGAVFYMELIEVKAPTATIAAATATTSTAGSSSGADAQQQQQQQQQRAPAALALEDSAKAVQLAVYGVEDVGEEIDTHLTRLLEVKLAELSCGVLSGLLARNPQFQVCFKSMMMFIWDVSTVCDRKLSVCSKRVVMRPTAA
jgi:hypothetical protein